MVSEFDDLFKDDNPDVITAEGDGEPDVIELAPGETYASKLEKDKGLTDPEEIAKSALHGDSHIKKLEAEAKTKDAEIQRSKDWINNQAGPAVKLAKEYINSDAYKKKYGLAQGASPPGDLPDDKKPAPGEDINAKIDARIAEKVSPALNTIGGAVTGLSEKGLLAEMKTDPRFPYLTEEVEKDMVEFLDSSKKSGNPYPATAVAMANLYNSFVGKNIDKVIESKQGDLRKDILKDIAEGNDSITESDRLGEEGIASLDEEAKDIAAMHKAHKNPLSFTGIK